MTLYEGLIIYLAAGAPFAVLFFLRNRRKSVFHAWTGTFVTWFFWVPRLMISVFSRRSATANDRFFEQFDDLDAEIQEKVRGILSLARSDGDFAAFRFALERFTELSIARMLSEPSSNSVESNLLGIAGHRNEKTGSACLRRKNQAKLAIHHANAAEDLFRLVDARNSDSEQIKTRLYHLCELLGDKVTADRFRDAKRIAGKFESVLSSQAALTASATTRESAVSQY